MIGNALRRSDDVLRYRPLVGHGKHSTDVERKRLLGRRTLTPSSDQMKTVPGVCNITSKYAPAVSWSIHN
jgi:hypothetical protein